MSARFDAPLETCVRQKDEMTTLNETLLDDLLGKLESVRTWSPRVISKLETLIRSGDDYSLFRINPIQFASEKGIAETEIIDLFLYAARLGLFEMEWHLVCATWGNVVAEQAVVKGVSGKLQVYKISSGHQ
jgi:hypothetical protein